jgi:hypothetical protein
VNIGPVQDPRPVTFGKKDSACFQNTFQHLPIGKSPNILGGEQSGTFTLSIGYMGTCFLKPVAAKVRLAGDSAIIESAEPVNVSIAQLPAHEFIAQEWRISNNEVHGGPVRLATFGDYCIH